MIRTPNDPSRFILNLPGSHGSSAGDVGHLATRSNSPQAAQNMASGATSSASAPQSTPASSASLAELRRLSQSLKPRRQGATEPLQTDLAQSGSLSHQSVGRQSAATPGSAARAALPRRRPASLDDIRSLKQQSLSALEQMAGPSARKLLRSTLFQS